MTPTEIRERLNILAQRVGPRAEITCHMTVRSIYSEGVSFMVWPDGVGGKGNTVSGGSALEWADAMLNVETKWAQVEEAHNETLIQRMAEKIMQLTFQHGTCTEGALRIDFGQPEIDRFGEAAASRANAVADKGPFSIVKDGPGNSPPEDTEAEAD
jgi:hypothetical protein